MNQAFLLGCLLGQIIFSRADDGSGIDDDDISIRPTTPAPDTSPPLAATITVVFVSIFLLIVYVGICICYHTTPMTVPKKADWVHNSGYVDSDYNRQTDFYSTTSEA